MLPKKGLRKITVNEVAYVWTTRAEHWSRQDLWITIALASNHNRMLHFSHSLVTKYKSNERSQITAITSRTIRQIIEAALKNGWEKAADGIFDSNEYSFELVSSIGSMFQIDILKNKIVEEKNFNDLDIDVWAFSPAKGYGEFYYLFYQETISSNSKSQEQLISEYYQNESFIIKMLSSYAKFLNIPHAKHKDFLSNQKYVNEPLSDKEIETHLLNFLKSEVVPLKLSKMKIESANSVFKESLSYGLIAKTQNGLLGFIWDHPG